MRRAARILLLAAVVPAAVAAETHVVRIEGMQFKPPTLTVHRGDRITWQNQDIVPHTATASGAFDSGVLAPGQGTSRLMDKPGRYPYACTLHPGMKGEVVVQ